MPPTVFSSVFFFLLIAFFTSTAITTPSSSTGVTNTNQQLHLLIKTLESLKFNSVRLIDSDPDIIRMFTHSSINLHLTIPNSLLPSIASNQSEALQWLNIHVTPFYSTVHITLISVGSDQSDSNTSKILLNAMNNTRRALNELGMDKIQVSTAFSFFDVMSTVFPPSSAQFQDSVAESLIKPVLNFLTDTNSTFLINMYPSNMYTTSEMIPIGYMIFQELPSGSRDVFTGLTYTNMFDVMVDSVIAAVASLGGDKDHMPVIVTETGLPGLHETEDIDMEMYGEMYVRGLVRHGGPSLRRNIAVIQICVVLDMSHKYRYRTDFFSSGALAKWINDDAADPDGNVAPETISRWVWKMVFLIFYYKMVSVYHRHGLYPTLYTCLSSAPIIVLMLIY